jgi:hypothetical protein
MLSVIMFSVVMLSVVMLNVVTPIVDDEKQSTAVNLFTAVINSVPQ